MNKRTKNRCRKEWISADKSQVRLRNSHESFSEQFPAVRLLCGAFGRRDISRFATGRLELVACRTPVSRQLSYFTVFARERNDADFRFEI